MQFVKFKGIFSIEEITSVGAFISRKNFSEAAIESFERNRDVSIKIEEDKIIFYKVFDKEEE